MGQFYQIQKNFDSTHQDLSKTVPTAPLASFPAELRAFEVRAFLTKIDVFTHTTETGDVRGAKNRVSDQKSKKRKS